MSSDGYKRLDPAAFYNLAGAFVRRIEPHTESDPAALLIQFLTAFGNIIGRNSYFPVEADRHFTNLNVVIVGDSAKARKGTSWGHIRRIFEGLDPIWKEHCIQSGLSTGEGLIWAVRDPIAQKDGGTDPGINDKRLLVVETEFAVALKVFERDGNKLSPIMRDAWDGRNLRSLTKSESAKATNAHISIIGHITAQELTRSLSQNEAANGFGNRILWVRAKRSKLLPDGGNIQGVNFDDLIEQLKAAVKFGKEGAELKFDADARALWHKLYFTLAQDKPGMFGTLTARAEAQVLRLASIFSLLESRSVIGVGALRAAIAVWDYCSESCRWIFGDATGDSIADRILEELRSCEAGKTLTEIHNDFKRNMTSARIQKALQLLEQNGLARRSRDAGSQGRLVERWTATNHEFNESIPSVSSSNSSFVSNEQSDDLWI